MQRRMTQKPSMNPISLTAVPEEPSRKGATKNLAMMKVFLMIREFRAPDNF